MIKNLFFLPIILIFIGCQGKDIYVDNTLYNNSISTIQNIKQYNLEHNQDDLEKQSSLIQSEYDNFILENSSYRSNLMDFYNEWKDVKYKFGGNSKKGIDCSAFTQRVLKEKFDVSIPRTTRTQVKVGKVIKKSNLKIGDLVFFKTGKTDRHVGIYMGNGEFMHASIKGIKFTKLDKPFYKKAYWTSRRVIN